MSVIAFPLECNARVSWALDQPAQVNRSEWTGRRETTLLPIAARWSAHVDFTPVMGQSMVVPMRGFIVQAGTPGNSFYLHNPGPAQHAGATPTPSGNSGPGNNTAPLKGFDPGTVMLAGHMMTFSLQNGEKQMVVLTQNLTADGSGNATATFAPRLRRSLSTAFPVETRRPYAEMALKGAASWSMDAGKIYDFGFDCEEYW